MSLSEQAQQLKDEANQYFKNEEYAKAIDLYSQAIKLDPNQALFYANRSIAHLKTEFFGYALEDASKAIELDPNYIKGYYRRAVAFMALGKFKEALKDFQLIIQKKPNDPDAKSKYCECNKMVKRLAFEKAICVSDNSETVSVASTINLDEMQIEYGYKGPHLVDNKVTIEFVNEMIKCFKNDIKLHRKYAFKIILLAKEHFEKLPSLVDVTLGDECNLTVCGDIHGQFYDLLHIFELNGLPSTDNPYLFNGDFVDRGSFSVECILTLFAFTTLYPNHFYMNRGNHESVTMNQMYGFAGEVKAKYSVKMYQLFSEVFNYLPLAHCINGKVLIMHGGLFSCDNVTLDDIRKIDRNRQPPDEGIMCEILWSDPMPNHGRSASKRGVGTQFGPDVTENFCKLNNLDYIIRSHEVKTDGYEVTHNKRCITVFSAPNYCDSMGNQGAYIHLKGNELEKPKFHVFSEVPHPNVKPMAYADSLFSFM